MRQNLKSGNVHLGRSVDPGKDKDNVDKDKNKDKDKDREKYIPYNCHFFYTDTIFGE